MNLSNLNNLLNQSKISYVDVGASKDILYRWKKYKKFYSYMHLNLLSEYKNLKIKVENKKEFKIFNYALAEKDGYKKFYEVEGIFQSSFLKPNYNFLNQFPNSERFKIKKELKINCKKFDSFKENFDFIKIDTQGYNYNVLVGGKNKLKNTLAIETLEVEFVQIYQNQKLFEDIKKYLQSKDFIFIDFIDLRRWSNIKNEIFGRMIFGNTLFIKNPKKVIKNYTQYKKLITILLIYNKLDLALKLSSKLKSNDRAIVKKYINKKKFLWFIPKTIFSLILRIMRIKNKNIDLTLFT